MSGNFNGKVVLKMNEFSHDGIIIETITIEISYWKRIWEIIYDPT